MSIKDKNGNPLTEGFYKRENESEDIYNDIFYIIPEENKIRGYSSLGYWSSINQERLKNFIPIDNPHHYAHMIKVRSNDHKNVAEWIEAKLEKLTEQALIDLEAMNQIPFG